MAFDGIVAKSIVYELNTCIIGGKINKIFEPNSNEIIVGIYSNGKNYALDICIDSSNCRLNLTTHSKPNPINAPSFCMLLRKHLIGFKIVSVNTVDLERIVTIKLEGYNELNDLISKTLIIELMGKHSNIILLNESNRIIDSLRHFDSSSKSNRNIMPSFEYNYPTSEKKSLLKTNTFDEFYKIISDKLESNKIEDILCNSFTGISKEFIYYMLNKEVGNNERQNKWADRGVRPYIDNINKLQILYNNIKAILNNINTNKVSPEETLNEKNKSDFVLKLSPKESNLSINYFIDDFYYNKELNDTFINYKNTISKLLLSNLNKNKKKLNNITFKINECSRMDLYKLYGELITANLYRIKDENQSEIELENYYDNNKPIIIPLDNSKTPSYNAKMYFKKYNKLKTALSIVEKQKEKIIQELNYIESIIYTLESSETISDLDEIYEEISETVLTKDRSYKAKQISTKRKQLKKKVKDKTWIPIEYNIEGFKILIGKNNKQNDYLTCKSAKSNDLWFHTKDIHGSHLIIKTEGKDVPYEVLEKCASLAAYYSKARNSSNVPVDYCFIKYVKKPKNSKPGMVIYTNNKTINVKPENI